MKKTLLRRRIWGNRVVVWRRRRWVRGPDPGGRSFGGGAKQSDREVRTMESEVKKGVEKQSSFRGLMERQKSIRIAMERQLSFGMERKRCKDSPGKRGDSSFHLAARAGSVGRLRDTLQTLDDSALKDLMCRRNQDGETALYAASENGHSSVVEELLKYSDLDIASITANNGFDPFHIAAKHGHIDVLKELLRAFPNLAMTTDPSNSTALNTAATQGHIDVVKLLLETDSELAKIARNNGKTALHSAARMGHLEVVRALQNNDSTSGFRTDKKGQTALHMAVKGQNMAIVLELISSDSAVANLEDKQGNTAVHIATKKGRPQMVGCLLSVEGVHVNTVNKAGESPLDIAEGSGNAEMAGMLKEKGGMKAKELVGGMKSGGGGKQLKQTVSDIKHDVQSQMQQSRQTRVRVQKIAKRLKKLHISGLNNAINSSTVVAVLIATVAFAAIFTVPGQYVEEKREGFSIGEANIARKAGFIVFFVSDSVALFISLAVVVVQTSVVVIEQKAKKQMMFVINKLMWLACLFISISFISLTYIVVGKEARWLAVYTTLVGASVMLITVASMCYCIVFNRLQESKLRSIQRGQSRSLSLSLPSEPDIINTDYRRMYVL